MFWGTAGLWENTQIIPSNTETYISVIKTVKLNRIEGSATRFPKANREKQVFLRIVFKNSLRFLGASIGALASSLDPATDFQKLGKTFPHNSDMLKRKGVFLYELIHTDEDYERIEFPERLTFSSCLNNEPISEEDYNFAITVYDSFFMQKPGWILRLIS